MHCYLVERIDSIMYCEDYAMVVIAKDDLNAERKARIESEDFKKAKLKVTPCNMDNENIVLIANTGA